MEQNKATAPGILKKSTAHAYTMEEKLRNMEKEIEAYKDRMDRVETFITELYDYSDEDNEPPVSGTFTIAWKANEQPRVTQRDREIAIWRMNNPTEPTIPEEIIDLTCDEIIN